MIAPVRRSVNFLPLTEGEGRGKLLPFETKDLILQPGALVQKYEQGRKSSAVKFGQLKLLISELEFLTLYWDPLKYPSPTCLYVGAAPGHHIRILAQLFPQIKFRLYDTQPFSQSLNECSNVTRFHKYFQKEDIETYKNLSDLFFISDIRSLNYSQGASYKSNAHLNEEIAHSDMRLQESWVKELRPVYSSLKFRLPYDIKEVRDKVGPTWRYLMGTIYLQPWSGAISSETRLIVPAEWSEHDYDYSRYEQMMFHHNMVNRSGNMYNSFIVQDSSTNSNHGYTNDYDSAATSLIVKMYLEKVGIIVTTDKVVKLMTHFSIYASGNSRRTLLILRTGASDSEDD